MQTLDSFVTGSTESMALRLQTKKVAQLFEDFMFYNIYERDQFKKKSHEPETLKRHVRKKGAF